MSLKTTIKKDELQAMFKQLNANSWNLRPPLIKIGGMLEDASEQAFQRQGPGWKTLTPKYKKRKIKEFGSGKKLLDASGILGDTVSAQIINNNTVVIGSNEDHAAVHQWGYPKRNIPARPYIIVGEAEQRKAIFIMSKHLVRGV